MNCEQVGLNLAECIRYMVSQRASEIRRDVGAEQKIVDPNLLVFFGWVTTWRVSKLIPASLARPALDAMHQPMFEVLAIYGLAGAEAEAFVHERYSVYYDAIKSREDDQALQRVAAYFVGFCNPNDEGAISYSLDLMKIVAVASEFAGFCEAIEAAFFKIIKESP